MNTKITAYFDESGTHDKTGALKGSSVVIVSGVVGWNNDWAESSSLWQAVLTNYNAPYFHFTEWAAASMTVRGKIKPSSDYGRNPYREWPLEKLDRFLYELAAIVGSGNKVLVGGYVNTSLFHQAAKTGEHGLAPAGGDPYQHCLNESFVTLPRDILSAWRYWTEPVSICFDRVDDSNWRKMIVSAHKMASEMDTRINDLKFEDKKCSLPLQAADLAAYRFRQLAENRNGGKLNFNLPKLDQRLLKGMFKQFDTTGAPPMGR